MVGGIGHLPPETYNNKPFFAYVQQKSDERSYLSSLLGVVFLLCFIYWKNSHFSPLLQIQCRFVFLCIRQSLDGCIQFSVIPQIYLNFSSLEVIPTDNFLFD